MSNGISSAACESESEYNRAIDTTRFDLAQSLAFVMMRRSPQNTLVKTNVFFEKIGKTSD